MTRSVLPFSLLPGRRGEFLDGFARLEVLWRASAQAGFLRAQLYVPTGRGDATSQP